jgi:hypothetical protein
MKKVSILLLLTVVLASFTFAIDGVGDFKAAVEIGLDNVSSGNGTDMGVTIEPKITFSRAFGAFGLSATLGDKVYITTADVDETLGDELYLNITPSYSLAAGPGQLGFALGIQLNFPLTSDYFIGSSYGTKGDALFFRIDPSISYGLDAGFGALSFEVGTDHLQLSKLHGDALDAYGLDRLPIYLQAGVELSFGLGLWLKPVLALQIDSDTDPEDTGLREFDLDIHYAITEQILAGVEVDIPTVEDGIKKNGVTVTPRGEFSFGAFGAYLKIELSQIGAKDLADDAKELQIKPIIGVSYSF